MRRRILILSLVLLLTMVLVMSLAACKPGYKEVWEPIKPYSFDWDKDNGDMEKITKRVNEYCIEEKNAERAKLEAENEELKKAGKPTKPNYADPEYLLSVLRDDGSFSSIEYDKDTKAFWPPLDHLRNVLFLQVARNDNREDNPYYMSEEIRTGVTKAMNYWVDKNYVCEWNWWYNEVGVGMYLPNIILFGVDGLSEESKSTMLKKIEGTLLHTKPMRFKLYERKCNEAGGNLTDQALSTLKFCLATGDGNTIMWVTEQIENELRFFPPYKGPKYHRWDAEGVKEDWSFQQHDQLLYYGGYGEVFLDGLNRYMKFTEGTQFSLDEKHVNFYADFLMNGIQFATRNGFRDINASGRGISRRDSLKGIYANVGRAIDELLTDYSSLLKDGRKEKLETIKANRYGDIDKGAGGHRYFYESDYNVYNGDKYMASVRHASDRTRLYEYLNGENPLAYYTGAGATFYYVNGDEYFNAMPTYDWNKVPGTTARQGNKVPRQSENFNYGAYGNNKYVGGVSNGKVGVSAYRMNVKGVSARKGYFMFEDGVVCLGADICTVLPHDTVTTINQALLKGDVIIGNGGKNTKAIDKKFIGKAEFIYHNNISYITDSEVELLIEKNKKGDWKTIQERGSNLAIENDMFTLSINHGKRPLGDKYAYTVLMNTTPEATAEYVVNPTLEVLANTKKVQAVYDSKNDIVEAIFHDAGKIKLPSGRELKVNKGAVIILENVSGEEVLTIASNDYRDHSVKVTLGDKKYEYDITKRPKRCEL